MIQSAGILVVDAGRPADALCCVDCENRELLVYEPSSAQVPCDHGSVVGGHADSTVAGDICVWRDAALSTLLITVPCVAAAVKWRVLVNRPSTLS